MSGCRLATQLPPAYTPLDAQQEQIRLLHLLPGSWEDPVSCTTSTVCISDGLVFESLSYSWGDPSVSRIVLLNGHAIAVTVNLFAALRRLRYRESIRCLWADALCINQVDLEEKSLQVSLMGKVYSAASKGLLWLGEHSELLSDIEVADRGLLENAIPEKNTVEAFDWLHRLAGDADSQSISHVDYELTRRPATPSCVSSLKMLLSLSWWNRMWTLQEAVLPRDVSFVCGSSEITLTAMDRAQEHYYEYQATIPQQELRDGPVNAVMDCLSLWVIAIAQLREVGDDRDIVHALFLCKARQATDPRDKIYAVLGLFPSIARYMDIDYNKDTAQVSTELLLCLVTLHGDLKALACAADTPEDLSLPSWVPNWCYMLESNMRGGEVGLIDEYDESFAARTTPAQVRTPCRGVLAILGISIDRVVALQPIRATSSHTLSKVLAESFRGWIDSLPISSLQDTNTYLGIIEHMIDRMRSLDNRDASLIITSRGLIGYACHDVQVNDTVHVLFGGNLPFILRASHFPGGQYNTLVCHCYMHGIMEGEALDWGLKPQWVFLV
ncbi:Heterokaryon incompatibility protein 6- OR allele [Apiospora marii]|uniref:Heterokaryon incompatibility protein 6- OR allele n=1 Tax=Apiospora marii TaxID=335849 RepID=UPI0031325A66